MGYTGALGMFLIFDVLWFGLLLGCLRFWELGIDILDKLGNVFYFLPTTPDLFFTTFLLFR